MTGFARSAGGDEQANWAWEIRSVNAKALDVRARVPGGFDRLEQAARARLAKRFKRGNISINLTIERAATVATYRVNRELLAQVVSLGDELGDAVSDARPSLEGMLAIRGILESVEEAEDEATAAAREAAMMTGLNDVVDALAVARGEEGIRLALVLDDQLDVIAGLVDDARVSAATQPAAIRQRLDALLAELLAGETKLSQDRLAQEAALLVGKADVREELDRLGAHLEQARELVASGEPVGRRLDFLCQEFNREANTLCAKAADVALTRIGLDLKARVEQFREQIQNIE